MNRWAAILLSIVVAGAVGACAKATDIAVVPSKDTLSANKQDTVDVTIRGGTKTGRPARWYNGPVTVTLSGPEVTMVAEGPIRFHNGTASVRLISTFATGRLCVSAEAPGLAIGRAHV